MTESDISKNDVPPEASLPEGAVSLESILCTEELRRRPWRPPDFGRENRALVALASALADSPRTILQTLAETILDVTQSDSAGLSLLTTDDGGKRFYWPAIAGIWKPHIGGGTPRNFGPCGDVLDRNIPMLFRHFERRYPYLLPVMPPAAECLLVPFYVGGKAVGTIWAITHDERRKFDAEDERLMSVLGQFASLAYQTLVSIDDLKFQIAEREKAESALRELTDALETRVRVRTEELEQEIAERKRAEEELRRSEADLAEAQRRFEGILDIAEDAIISVDSNQRIVLFNQGAERVFGYVADDVLGQPLDILLPQRFAPVHRGHIQAFAKAPEVSRLMGQRREVFSRRKDGSEFPAEASISKLDLGGELVFTVILRDITERKRADSRLNTQYAITRILSESASIDEAAPRIVQSICECLDWKVGEIWRVDGETKPLTFVRAWHLPSGDFAEFASASLRFTFPTGVGLPGRVCESRKPLWIRNLAEDSNFLRVSLATKAGLHCGFGFPILLGEESLGAMVFFSREVREPDHDVLQMMANIGSQIGQFIERRRAEEGLRRSEGRFRQMADAIHEVIWFTALEPERVLYVSPSFERIWGLPVEDLYRNPRLWTETIHPEDRDRVTNTFARWIAGEEVNYHDIEFRIIQPNGTIRWIHERGVLSLNEQGKPYRVSGISTDVTDRKGAEEELRRSEAYLAEAQRLSRTGSFGWNVSSGELIWSKETFCILGYDQATKPSLDLVFTRVHPEDFALVQQTMDRASRDGADLDFEHRLLMPDGSVKHVHVVAHAVRDELDALEFVGAVSDVTAARKAEERIRQDEREFRQIVEAIPALILVLAPDGNPLYANERVLEYTGLTLEDFQAGDFRERVFHPSDVERLRDERRQALARGVSFSLEQRARRKDGQYRWFIIRYEPLLHDQGHVIRWYATGTDIDDRKQAEERVRNENLALREEIDKASMFEEIVGASPVLRAVLARVAKVASTDSTVLITGETGTGKELIARAIHKRSPRAARAFVGLNCAAVPPALIASELFGHEKGAFTGAVERRLGRFELAEGGTLFLDEIGELPAETQITLLRVLQEREFERVGGRHTIRADVRVIAAANRDLQAAIAAGAFRSDLFYRLNVFPIEMPPLRDRKEDIPMLVAYFVDRYASKVGKKIRGVDKRTLALLQAYPWPGNIRELQNVIERSVVVCETETFSVDESWLSREAASPLLTTQTLSKRSVAQEREKVEAALAETRGRVSGRSGAAAKLGLPPSTLESKIRSLKINKHRFKPV